MILTNGNAPLLCEKGPSPIPSGGRLMGNLEHRDDHGDEGLNLENIDLGLCPYWKRAHRDWRFWAGAFFISAVIVMTWYW